MVGGVGTEEDGTDDGGGDGVGQGGGEALLEDAVHALAVQQQLQHRGDARPADHMDGHLAQIETDQHFSVPAGGVQACHIGQYAQQTAEGGTGEDPAPAELAEIQIDGDVAQKARQSADPGAADHRQESQKAVLDADVDRFDGAGDDDECTQQEKQRRTGGDDAEPPGGQMFHGVPPV